MSMRSFGVNDMLKADDGQRVTSSRQENVYTEPQDPFRRPHPAASLASWRALSRPAALRHPPHTTRSRSYEAASTLERVPRMRFTV